MSKDLKELSKRTYLPDGGSRTYEAIQTGCIQRVAESLEQMAQPYLRLIESVEYLQNRNKTLSQENESMALRIRALRGVITRMKNKETDNGK